MHPFSLEISRLRTVRASTRGDVIAGVPMPITRLRNVHFQPNALELGQVLLRAAVIAMGVNADGRRELLGLAVGDSETESFWCEFIGSLNERGLSGVKLVISDAHVGLTNAIRRMLQRVPIDEAFSEGVAHQGMVTAALRSVFSQEDAVGLVERWDDLAASLAERFPRAAEL